MSFIKALKTKYRVVAKDTRKDAICKDLNDLMVLEQKEFVIDDAHLSLEKRTELIDQRKKQLEKDRDRIIDDINSDPKLTPSRKKSDIKRLYGHIDHYEKGLVSMANAIAWRDAEKVITLANKTSVEDAAKKFGITPKTIESLISEKKGIPDEEWRKKILEPKGDKLSSSKPGGIASFAIPAGLTCPKAGTCKNHCFALSGHSAYVQMVRDTHSAALGLSERDDFVNKVNDQLQKKWPVEKYPKPNPKNPYRIHAWGDFYSNKYAQKWLDIINGNKNIWFYAYTKSFTMPAVKELIKGIKSGKIKNAKIIQSINGKSDKDIDHTQPVAVVLKSKSDMDSWNDGVKKIKEDAYAKQKANRLAELAPQVAKQEKQAKDLKAAHEKNSTKPNGVEKDFIYQTALLTKELRKLKKEAPSDREKSYANLVNLLDGLNIKPSNGKFIECSDNDLVASDPKVKRIGIVEHGELHQPSGYTIEGIEPTLAGVVRVIKEDNAEFEFGDMQNVHCEHMHSV